VEVTVIKFNAYINFYDASESLVKEIEWPVLPRCDDIFLFTPETECVVKSVQHRIIDGNKPCINVLFYASFGGKDDFIGHGWVPEEE